MVKDNAHMRFFSFVVDSHSCSSSSIVKTISVPRPSVLPLGSGNTSKESPTAEETKVYWIGSGVADVAGGREDTRTVGETRKLGICQL